MLHERADVSNKSRTISVRLSDKEYREIKARCGDLGHLKVSEFVRQTMKRALSSTDLASPGFLDGAVAALCARVEKMERRLTDDREKAGIRGSTVRIPRRVSRPRAVDGDGV